MFFMRRSRSGTGSGFPYSLPGLFGFVRIFAQWAATLFLPPPFLKDVVRIVVTVISVASKAHHWNSYVHCISRAVHFLLK
jgi:hypothetical protein